MGAKLIAYDQEARQAIHRGVKQLADAVKVTLGPRGRNVMIQQGWGSPLVTKDGVTVAKSIDLPDPWENMGAQLVKEVASKTSDNAGDGTTTATVLAEAIFARGLAALQAGVKPVQLKRGIEKAMARALAHLRTLSRPVSGSDEVAQVGAIAANNDAEIGRVLADALDRVGKDGVITVDDSSTLETTVEIVDGLSIDRGYLSPYFVNVPETLSCELEDAAVLLYDGKIGSVRDLVPVLEQVLQSQRPLLILAEDVEGEALALLVVNALRGALKVCAVKSPGYGDARKAQLHDLAALLGGRVISQETGLTLEGVGPADLGSAKRVVIKKDETTLIEGGGDETAIKGRQAQLKAEIAAQDNDYERGRLEERLAKLAGGVARVLVGANTESEMKEKKARVEDAMHATRAAVAEGVVPGGGVALLRCVAALDGLDVDADEEVGVRIVREALTAPIRQIALNAGQNPAVIMNNVLANSASSWGYNAQTLEYGDLLAQGVLDPTKVTRTAFENAVSVATLLLTTDAVVGEKAAADEDEGDDHDGHGH